MTRKVLLSAAALLLLTFSALADNEDLPRPKERANQGNGERAHQRFKHLDQDNDGRISHSEWKGNERAFSRIDANNDGFVTEEELRSAVQGLREKRGRPGLQQMDSNGDGNISRSEWKGDADVFNRLDRDNDGVLSPGELNNRPGKHPDSGRPRPNNGGTSL